MDNENILPADSVRDLGANLDPELSMRTHVSRITQVCYPWHTCCKYQLWHLRQIRRLLERSITASLVAAPILSRLDYCNTLLAGLPRTTTAPLQRVINAAARLVFNLRPRDPVLPALTELHWLPVESRVQYKLCLLAHSARVGKAPVYITSLLQPVRRFLTSQIVIHLYARLRTTTCLCHAQGTRQGSATGLSKLPPQDCGTPLDIRSTRNTQTFKKKLKTYLFHRAYEQLYSAHFLMFS